MGVIVFARAKEREAVDDSATDLHIQRRRTRRGARNPEAIGMAMVMRYLMRAHERRQTERKTKAEAPVNASLAESSETA